jgi:hypothetical protein
MGDGAMSYPDQVKKIRDWEETSVEFSDELAYRLQQADVYLRRRFAYYRPGPTDPVWLAVQDWIVYGGARPW